MPITNENEKINIGWLKDYTGKKFVPKTISTQIYNINGTLYKDTVDQQIAKKPGYVVTGKGLAITPSESAKAAEGAEVFNDLRVSVIKYNDDIFDENDQRIIGNVATGLYSHAEGSASTAAGNYSHTEGFGSSVLSPASHAEGFQTKVNCGTEVGGSHSEGIKTQVFAIGAHAEGSGSVVSSSGHFGHAEGYGSKVLGEASHAEGYVSIAEGNYSHAEGYLSLAMGNYSHTEGNQYLQLSCNISGNANTKNYTVFFTEDYNITTSILSKLKESKLQVKFTAEILDASENKITVPVSYFTYNGKNWTMYCTNTLSSSALTDYPCIIYLQIGALGEASHVEGKHNIALGDNSHSEGYKTQTHSNNSHSEGYFTAAYGNNSHVEGNHNNTEGDNSHAEGQYTISYGENSHAEGYNSYTIGLNSHAEGNETTSVGDNSHSEGYLSAAYGNNSHSEGCLSIAYGDNSHSEGNYIITHYATIIENNSNRKYVKCQLTLNENDNIQGFYDMYRNNKRLYILNNNTATKITNVTVRSPIEPNTELLDLYLEELYTGPTSTYILQPILAEGNDSHAEGSGSQSLGKSSHAEGNLTKASGITSHAEGNKTNADGDYSHAEGNETTARGKYSHAEGNKTTAYGDYSHAEGNETTAYGNYSHAEGNLTRASGISSHAEGNDTSASGNYSHAEGNETVASGDYSHARGNQTSAYGDYSYAGGNLTKAYGEYSYANGNYIPISVTLDTILTSLPSRYLTFYFPENLNLNYNNLDLTNAYIEINNSWYPIISDRKNDTKYSLLRKIQVFYEVDSFPEDNIATLYIPLQITSEAIGSFSQGEGNISKGKFNFCLGYCNRTENNYSQAYGENNYIAGDYSSVFGDNLKLIDSKHSQINGQPIIINNNEINSPDEAMKIKFYNKDKKIYEIVNLFNKIDYFQKKPITNVSPYIDLETEKIIGWAGNYPYFNNNFQFTINGVTYDSESIGTNFIVEVLYGEKEEESEIHLLFTSKKEISGLSEENELEISEIKILNTIKKSNFSTIYGEGNYIEGSYENSSDYTSIFGEYNHCEDNHQMLICGNNNTLNYNTQALTLGNHNELKRNTQNTIIGDSNKPNYATQTLVIGNSNAPRQTTQTLIIGNNNEPSYVKKSIIIGENNEFSASNIENSIMAGVGNKFNTSNSLVLGQYNKSTYNHIIAVGNGTDDENRKTSFSVTTGGIVTAEKVYGAVWNDYAEYRNQKEFIEPGYCVASQNNGQIYKTTEKFQACDGIVSDTFGFAIGETDECKTPLAIAGRVLAYYNGNKEDYHAGDTVCAGPNGKICKMTREEIREWPDRIIGIVSEIPEYEIWGSGNIQVNNRIWIKIK